MRVLRRGVVFAVAFLVAASALAAAQTPEATLPSKCTDQQVAPVSVMITCGDGGFIAEQLAWTNWGAEQATTTGVASVNDCDPSCVDGQRHDYPVVLTASELRDCDHGEPQYTRVVYSFPAESPFPPGSPGADDPLVAFPCPKQPHPDPRIRSMRIQLTGHGPPGESYFVRVQLRLRVCAVRGDTTVVINEVKRIRRHIFGEHTRSRDVRQRKRCQVQRFRWRLRDEFFGVGFYEIKATVWDRDAQFSKTVSRKQITRD